MVSRFTMLAWQIRTALPSQQRFIMLSLYSYIGILILDWVVNLVARGVELSGSDELGTCE